MTEVRIMNSKMHDMSVTENNYKFYLILFRLWLEQFQITIRLGQKITEQEVCLNKLKLENTIK